MKLRWHGHACFEMTDNVTVVTDPHDGKSIGIRAPNVRADVVLISHDHFDHNCFRAVKGVHTQAVTQAGEFEKAGVAGIALPTYHDEQAGAKRGNNLVFKFKLGGLEFCHLGDLGHMPEDAFFDALGGVDVLFLPVGGVFTIDAGKALEIIQRIKPKVAVPMHFRIGGLSLSIKPIEPFRTAATEAGLETFSVGNEVEILREDLPENTEAWVFSL